MPTPTKASIGWIGAGRMGYEMAGHLAKHGADVLVWNRTRAKAEPLGKHGAKIADQVSELAARDIVFCMVSTWDDVKEVMAALLKDATKVPRIVKICHNVFLGVVVQSLAEITILAQKAGVPRHAFLDFMNQSVMGSTFSRYKTPALVNLDFHVTFTPQLLRKDLDLGLDAAKHFEVPMPLASITRDLIQSLIGNGLDDEDFAKLIVQQARASGLQLKSENAPVGDGLSG